MKIVSITDPLTASGMKLAGIEKAYKVEEAGKAEEIFEEAINEKDIGVIILTEKLANKMDDKVLDIKEKTSQTTPIVIEIPSKEGPEPERREMVDKLVKQAVGIKVQN